MWIYLLVFLLCIAIGALYVLIIRQILKWTTNHNVPSPFALWKEFWIEWKKFGTVYLIWDLIRFVIEMFILGTGNAIVIRLVAIMITFTTSGFFGRWRNLVIRKIQKDTQKHHHIFWEFLGDTFASLVFWVPMYIVQVMMLVFFDLTHRSNLRNSVYVGIWAILLFGRFGCFAADLVERWLFNKKK